jgi:hypothetical protein
MGIPEHQRRVIARGIAVLAVSLGEKGETQQDAGAAIIAYLVYDLLIDEADLVSVIRDAAAAVASLPQPVDEPAERLERGRPIRELLGLPEPSTEIVRTLRARELLENRRTTCLAACRASAIPSTLDQALAKVGELHADVGARRRASRRCSSSIWSHMRPSSAVSAADRIGTGHAAPRRTSSSCPRSGGTVKVSRRPSSEVSLTISDPSSLTLYRASVIG